MLQFFGWTLSSYELDINGDIINPPLSYFHFDAEINTGDIKINTDEVRLNNYSRFPVFSSGLLNFEEISLKCLPYNRTIEYSTINTNELEDRPTVGSLGIIYYDIDTGIKYIYSSGAYIVTDKFFISDNTTLQPIQNFITDKSIKILRNGSGRAWQVYTHDFSYKYMDTISNPDNSQPLEISFIASQVGEIIE